MTVEQRTVFNAVNISLFKQIIIYEGVIHALILKSGYTGCWIQKITIPVVGSGNPFALSGDPMYCGSVCYGTDGKVYGAKQCLNMNATWLPRHTPITGTHWSTKWEELILKVQGQNWGKSQTILVSNPATGDILGTVQSNNAGSWTLKVSNHLPVPCLIWAESAQSFAQKKVQNAPAVCSGSPGTLAFGFNNLGMHCYDSDYSVFSILPPFNTVNAQVVRRGTGGNKPVILDPTQADLYYRAVKDEKASINKTSKDKTNFWDYVEQLFGVALPVDEGLTGHKMPGSGNFPQAFAEFVSHDFSAGPENLRKRQRAPITTATPAPP